MRALYQIRADISKSIEWIIFGEGEEPVCLEDLDIEAEEKIKNCFWAMNRLSAEAAEADIIIKNAQDYKKKRLEAIDRIEADVKITMEVMGIDKVDAPDCRVTLGKGREKVDVINERLIPLVYTRLVPESRSPDKVAILAALKKGEEIPGCVIGIGERGLTYPKIKGE